MKILLATDGSTHSEHAARMLVALRPPADAQVQIVYVIEPPHYWQTPAPPPGYVHEWHKVEREMRREAEDEARNAIERVRLIIADGGVKTESAIREGHPADEIVTAAEEHGAELVVVGSVGQSGSLLFLLGSVAQKVAKYAPCSVLVTRPPQRAGEPAVDRVVLATDGSENSLEAARFLSAFRLSQDVEIRTLHVMHRPPQSRSAKSAMDKFGQARSDYAREVIQSTTECLTTDARVTTAIREGDPAEEILRAATEISADLVVTGSKGLGGIKRFLLGGVSQKVFRYSNGSVLLVKPGAARAKE